MAKASKPAKTKKRLDKNVKASIAEMEKALTEVFDNRERVFNHLLMLQQLTNLMIDGEKDPAEQYVLRLVKNVLVYFAAEFKRTSKLEETYVSLVLPAQEPTPAKTAPRKKSKALTSK